MKWIRSGREKRKKRDKEEKGCRPLLISTQPTYQKRGEGEREGTARKHVKWGDGSRDEQRLVREWADCRWEAVLFLLFWGYLVLLSSPFMSSLYPLFSPTILSLSLSLSLSPSLSIFLLLSYLEAFLPLLSHFTSSQLFNESLYGCIQLQDSKSNQYTMDEIFNRFKTIHKPITIQD